jgi:hypothetical protein
MRTLSQKERHVERKEETRKDKGWAEQKYIKMDKRESNENK